MTEIIDFLKKYTDGKQNTEKVEISVLQLNRVIKALQQESCEECSRVNNPNPYYDCISRQNAIDVMWQELDEDTAHKVRDILETQPPVTPKPKIGHWIKCMPADEEWCYQCSECNFWRYQKKVNLSRFKFCPNCGAKMESEDKE